MQVILFCFEVLCPNIDSQLLGSNPLWGKGMKNRQQIKKNLVSKPKNEKIHSVTTKLKKKKLKMGKYI